MGGWDYYCLLCSAGFHIPYELDDETEYENRREEDQEDQDDSDKEPSPDGLAFDTFSRETLRENLDWLQEFRLIGLNRQVTGLKRCFVSGPATEQDYGNAEIERGDHPNAQSLPGGILVCYELDEHDALHYPIHDQCLAILCEAFARAQDQEYHWTPQSPSMSLPMDLDVLHQCLAGKSDTHTSLSNLVCPLQTEQYFWVDYDNVFFYFNPRITIPRPEHDNPTNTMCSKITVPPTTDMFGTLPVEILFLITDHLDPKDLIVLIKASKKIHTISCDGNFWLRRLPADAPWSGDSSNFNERVQRITDWKKYHSELMTQVLTPKQLARKGLLVSGLANRQRIWLNSQEVIRWYEEICPLKSLPSQKSFFESEAICQSLPRVASQINRDFQDDTRFCFDNIEDIKFEKTIEVCWSNEVLCGIKIHTRSGTYDYGMVGTHEPHNLMHFDDTDWIDKIVLNLSTLESLSDTKPHSKQGPLIAVTGIKIHKLSGGFDEFGQSQGYKRLLEPASGRGIVGFKTELAEQRIVRFGMLEHHQGPHQRRPALHEKIRNILWDDNLPASHLQFGELYSGYWAHDRTWYLTPMEVLIFGNNEQELSEIVCIAGSLEGNRFEVHRRDGTTSAVGTSQTAMKRYRIDGPGGERILGYDLGVGGCPHGVRFITNRNRSLVFGSMLQNSRFQVSAKLGMGLAGIYGNFGGPHSVAFGSVETSRFTTASPSFDIPLDGHIWDPVSPGSSWRMVGQTYGPASMTDHVAFIDFHRPALQIAFMIPHQGYLSKFMAAFAITYLNEVQMSQSTCFGSASPQWPSDPNATEATFHPDSGSHDSPTTAPQDEDMDTTSNTSEGLTKQPTLWRLDSAGEELVAVTVWVNDYLEGIQFHAENGKDSPRWGNCEGEPKIRIERGGSENIIGVKVFMSSINRHISYPSPLIQAIQAVGGEAHDVEQNTETADV